MATYNIEENPNLFIAPRFFADKFVYRMFHADGDENEILVRIIDLRSDKLMIHGTEMEESMLERLHQSLILKQMMGSIRVNCYGACYFAVAGKGRCTPVHNVIFDWSQFGVTVPNSINDSLKKRLEQKEKEIDEMKHQLSSAEAEASSTKAALEAMVKESQELKEQLSACKRDRNDMEAKLQKVCCQFSSTDSELLPVTTQLEHSNARVMELEEQLSTFKDERQNMELELQKLQGQLSVVNSELESIKTQLESSNRIVRESEDQLAFHRKEILDLCSSKSQLVSSNQRIKELEEQLSASKKDSQEMGAEILKVQNQLLSMVHNMQSSKSLLELSVKMLQELKDQIFTLKKEDLHGEAEFQKLSRHLWSIDSEVKSTQQKLEEMLNGFNHCCCPQFSTLQGTRSRHSLLPPQERRISMNNLPLSVAIEEDIHIG